MPYFCICKTSEEMKAFGKNIILRISGLSIFGPILESGTDLTLGIRNQKRNDWKHSALKTETETNILTKRFFSFVNLALKTKTETNVLTEHFFSFCIFSSGNGNENLYEKKYLNLSKIMYDYLAILG
ncbi:hypothetical protein C1645_736561 [Glomus cerebriforme]|uniref:Uncharacterized protein n=1 Tax=Glomus cerebriforme TaxID=658196 RepID=A0A397T7E2_9GLOM|nr:hypothetical protein C1645_736561 [Glomus cerebriforme]